jgi:hypothetical protein
MATALGKRCDMGIVNKILFSKTSGKSLSGYSYLYEKLYEALIGTPEERLEGDGAEYYTLAPTALSFRSTAPLNELQEVQINGVTVDPANYTLEEGSTIVTFPIEYLKTLDKGDYEVTIASENKTVKGNFTVAVPELNEYGFYYNQPYTAYVDYFGTDFIFFMHNDGTIDVITMDGGREVCAYTVEGNNITIDSPSSGTFNGTVSPNGTEIYCNELRANFVLGNESVVADEDYLYLYKEDFGGYEVTAIDKTKAEYGAIKTGINGIDTVKLSDLMFQCNTNMAIAPKIPNSVIYMGSDVFAQCKKLEAITIGDSFTNIGHLAFSYCYNLKSVVIGNGITMIEANAFTGCNSLTSITFKGTIEQWNTIEKDTDWNLNVPATHVHCIDGQVSIK